jgi:hypothetical protein
MLLKLNISTGWFRLAIVCLLVLTMLIGAILGNLFAPVYFLVFMGSFWGLLGIAIYLRWIRIALKCKKCGQMSALQFEVLNRPAERGRQPVFVCPDCGTNEPI